MIKTFPSNKSWIITAKSMNIMLNYSNSNNRLDKTQTLKIFSSWKEETTSHWRNAYLTWRTWRHYGIWLLWSICNTTIGRLNSGDKSRLMFWSNKIRFSQIKSRVSTKKSDSLRDGRLLVKKLQTWLLYWTWLKVWEEITCKIDIGSNLRTKQELNLITKPQLSASTIFSDWSCTS